MNTEQIIIDTPIHIAQTCEALQFLRVDCKGYFDCVLWLNGHGKIHMSGDGALSLGHGDILLMGVTPNMTVECIPSVGLHMRIDPLLLPEYIPLLSSINATINSHAPTTSLICITTNDFDKYEALINERLNAAQTASDNDIPLTAFIVQLFTLLYIDCLLSFKARQNCANVSPLTSRIIAYVNEKLSEELTLDSISRHFSYNKQYVCRQFKKDTGKTLVSYIQECRIKRAIILLQEEKSHTKIAKIVGFNNYSYYYKTFKRITGCSPTHFILA